MEKSLSSRFSLTGLGGGRKLNKIIILMCCNNILFCCNIFFKILRTKKCVEPGNFLINCQHDLNKLQRKSALNSRIYIDHVEAMG